jgi:hypothetical protein
VAQGVGPEFKPQYWKKEKKIRWGCTSVVEWMISMWEGGINLIPSTHTPPPHKGMFSQCDLKWNAGRQKNRKN